MSGQIQGKDGSREKADDGAVGSAEKEGECEYCGGSGRCQKCDGISLFSIDTICPACNGTRLCYCRQEPVKPAQ